MKIMKGLKLKEKAGARSKVPSPMSKVGNGAGAGLFVLQFDLLFAAYSPAISCLFAAIRRYSLLFAGFLKKFFYARTQNQATGSTKADLRYAILRR
jgi:hypothetical protein